MLIINKDKCVGCGVCHSICPVATIHETEDGKYEINPDECMECYSCMNTCPSDAIYEED